jgi:GH24 family phage-related lysozyme (muramidase)
MSFYDNAANYVKKWEGFTDVAKWDVNAWRIGHGSDTLTLPDGTYRKVLKTDKTTKELAAKDLARRIQKEFEPKVINKIGATYYNRLPDPAKIALISFAYNYGSIVKPAIVEAAKTGDVNKIGDAIVSSTINDNKGTPYYAGLRKRREDEGRLAKSEKKVTSSSGTTTSSTTSEEVGEKSKFKIVPIVLIAVTLGLVAYMFIEYKNKKNGRSKINR